MIGGSEDGKDEIVNGVDVAPRFFRRILCCLDQIQMDAIGEEIPSAGQHDHLRVGRSGDTLPCGHDLMGEDPEGLLRALRSALGPG